MPDPSNVCDANSRVPSLGGHPTLKLVMVATDHAPFGSAAAFFKDSMSRVAMTGVKIGCALRDAS